MLQSGAVLCFKPQVCFDLSYVCRMVAVYFGAQFKVAAGMPGTVGQISTN
jgi:hypothetical protein